MKDVASYRETNVCARNALQHNASRRLDRVRDCRMLGVEQATGRIDLDRHAVSGSDHAPSTAAAGNGPRRPRQ